MKYRPPEKMTKLELKDWLGWAENELQEYKHFIKTLKGELRKR